MRRLGSRVSVRYRAEAATVLISAARAGVPDVAVARRLRGPRGVATIRLPSGGPYVVSASAFSERGARSAIVTSPLR